MNDSFSPQKLLALSGIMPVLRDVPAFVCTEENPKNRGPDV